MAAESQRGTDPLRRWRRGRSAGLHRGGNDKLPRSLPIPFSLGEHHAARARSCLVTGVTRWEEPLPMPLYVTFSRAASILDVPYGKMHGLSFCLETRYFGEKGGAPRILFASLEEVIELRDAGEDAQAILAARRGFRGWRPFPHAATRLGRLLDVYTPPAEAVALVGEPLGPYPGGEYGSDHGSHYADSAH